MFHLRHMKPGRAPDKAKSVSVAEAALLVALMERALGFRKAGGRAGRESLGGARELRPQRGGIAGPF